MWVELVAVSIWGGMVALDTTAALQLMISQPLVAASVIGLLMGNVMIGFTIGLLLQLVWLNELPIGAAYFSEGNIGAAVAAAVAILCFEATARLEPVLLLALIWGILTSYIGGKMVILLRNFNGKRYHTLLTMEPIRMSHIRKMHLSSIAQLFICGVLITMITTLLGGRLFLPAVIDVLPVFVDAWLAPVQHTFLGIGCAVLLYIFVNKKNWLLLGGSLIGGFVVFLTI